MSHSPCFTFLAEHFYFLSTFQVVFLLLQHGHCCSLVSTANINEQALALTIASSGLDFSITCEPTHLRPKVITLLLESKLVLNTAHQRLPFLSDHMGNLQCSPRNSRCSILLHKIQIQRIDCTKKREWCFWSLNLHFWLFPDCSAGYSEKHSAQIRHTVSCTLPLPTSQNDISLKDKKSHSLYFRNMLLQCYSCGYRQTSQEHSLI